MSMHLAMDKAGSVQVRSRGKGGGWVVWSWLGYCLFMCVVCWCILCCCSTNNTAQLKSPEKKRLVVELPFWMSRLQDVRMEACQQVPSERKHTDTQLDHTTTTELKWESSAVSDTECTERVCDDTLRREEEAPLRNAFWNNGYPPALVSQCLRSWPRPSVTEENSQLSTQDKLFACMSKGSRKPLNDYAGNLMSEQCSSHRAPSERC